MQGPRQAKRILNHYRKMAAKRGRKNGGYGWLDDYGLERLIATSKKRYRRNLIAALSRFPSPTEE